MNYQICKKCIMDTTDPEIRFDANGVCNHCFEYGERAKNELHYDRLEYILKDIKGKKYDCIIGLSGGVDSSMVAYHVKRLGLNPLAVHLDNGWNTELSVNNIENIVKKLGIDLYTYVIDWNEFKDLQLSFLKASVPNSEIPTDHAITAIIYDLALKNNIKYIISGGNIVTEAIMPEAWGYNARDLKHLKAIHKRFGSIKLKTYPFLSPLKWAYGTFIKRIRIIPILNYIEYNKEEAKEIISKELGWRDYGGKHCESIYTRFFQGYILPKKFGFDKRRAHLSTLINSGQTTREQALKEMENDPYSNNEMLIQDKEYVSKKLSINIDSIMNEKPRSYKEYPNMAWFFKKDSPYLKLVKKIITRNK